MLRLSESDLRFIIETVATSRRDYNHIADLVRGKDDLLDPMLEDPKLVQRLCHEEETFLRISPHLLFSVLLRQVKKDLQKEAYILEADPRGRRIPIFEAPAVVEVLSHKPTRDYLAEMLASFARTNSGVIYWKERGSWHKKRFSDIDLDDMIELAGLIERDLRPTLYKRIADIALFLSGIFPDHLTAFAARHKTMFSAKRTLKDYEQTGKHFYGLAVREIDQKHWQPAMGTLAERFTLARWALNTLSDRYIKTLRDQYFRVAEEN